MRNPRVIEKIYANFKTYYLAEEEEHGFCGFGDLHEATETTELYLETGKILIRTYDDKRACVVQYFRNGDYTRAFGLVYKKAVFNKVFRFLCKVDYECFVDNLKHFTKDIKKVEEVA